MSTLDSSMNSVSTVVLTDFYKRFIPNARPKKMLLLAKLITLIIGLSGTGFALYMAKQNIASLFDWWMGILGLIGGAIGGVFMLGIFTKRANWPGVLIGAIASFIITFYVKGQGEIHFMLYSSVAVLSCVVIGYLFSLFFAPLLKQVNAAQQQ